ncbi:MAG: MerR family transcriptional regulator [Nocardioides sp.]|nr:MerR family transcriptional regulator [Nocardioides sp.]
MRGTTMANSDHGTMQIGEVATRTELSLRSLRHWDEVGLLRPSGRSEGGFRLYTEDDVERILVIRRMKPLGFTLEQMRAVMVDIDTLRASATGGPGAPEEVETARLRLGEIAHEAAERRAKLERQLEMADEFIGILTAAM